MTEIRDVFLSHDSRNKDLVRTLAIDIENETWQGRNLSVWFDEAEIGPGESITGKVNQGLEMSRFFALLMTPEYFDTDGRSGWTAAEWHAGIFSDPDNRQSRIIPIMLQTCPFIPPLLSHLRYINLRPNNYDSGLLELLNTLKEIPFKRPVYQRGASSRSGVPTEREKLLIDRAPNGAEPDPINEDLFCNLLPIPRLPKRIYLARVGDAADINAGKKESLKKAIYSKQMQGGVSHPIVPAFRLHSKTIYTFEDLTAANNLMEGVIDHRTVESRSVDSMLDSQEDRNLVTALLNMAVSRHVVKCGLHSDPNRIYRFFFPLGKNHGENKIEWRPFQSRTKRTVAKPLSTDPDDPKCIHQGATVHVLFIAGQYYLQIIPTWVLTSDGKSPLGGSLVTKIVNRWLLRERNLHVMYHVRLWSYVLGKNKRKFEIRAGSQFIQVESHPASINMGHGISNDRKNLLASLESEADVLDTEEQEIIEHLRELNLSAAQDSREDFEDIDENDFDHR